MKRKFFEYNTTKGLIDPYWDEFTSIFWGHLSIYRAYDVKLTIVICWWTEDPFHHKGNKYVQHVYKLLHICDICKGKHE